MQEIIDDAIEFVKRFFKGECSGHDYFHTMRVYNIAVKLAEKENACINTVALASLLHDVDDEKLSSETYKNKDNARNFLRSHNVPEDSIDKICRIIDEVFCWY